MDERTRTVTVASVPSGHAYVRHLAPEGGGGPVRLPDPDPDEWSREARGRWWPPAMLEPDWVRAHAAEVDLLHLHFGFDDRTPEQLAELVAALRASGTPLVQTVHDLRNPHHEDRAAHDAQLDVLVPAADALVTLTAGAADEIRRRWHREATVLPHPHVVPLGRVGRPRAPRERFVVGLHLKSLRANTDPGPLLPVLVEAVAGLPGAVLRVDAHRDLMTGRSHRRDAALVAQVAALAERGSIELHVHDYFSDAELWDYLEALDVSVLPYRFGTHSGWLEACRDVGTTVLAPTCGRFAEQGPVLTYRRDETHFVPETLVAAVRQAHQRRPALGATQAERRRDRRRNAVGHDLVYRAVMTR